MDDFEKTGRLINKIDIRQEHYFRGLINENELINYVDHELLIYLQDKELVFKKGE